MTVTVDMLDCAVIPKRGDLMHTNVGDRRERTFIVLHAHRLKPTKSVPRCKVWAERWWDMEPELRMALFVSAERNGGQRVINFTRYKGSR
jgi:hypothetical protein